MAGLPGSSVLVNLSASEISKLADCIIAKSKETYDRVASIPFEKVYSWSLQFRWTALRRILFLRVLLYRFAMRMWRLLWLTWKHNNFLWFNHVFFSVWYQHQLKLEMPVWKPRDDWMLTSCCAGAFLICTYIISLLLTWSSTIYDISVFGFQYSYEVNLAKMKIDVLSNSSYWYLSLKWKCEEW